MQQHGIKAKGKRKFVATTDSKHASPRNRWLEHEGAHAGQFGGRCSANGVLQAKAQGGFGCALRPRQSILRASVLRCVEELRDEKLDEPQGGLLG